jgi:hypothetical protein
MRDAALVRKTATDFLNRMGIRAVPYLKSQAVSAAGMGDPLSERAWLDIAAVHHSLKSKTMADVQKYRLEAKRLRLEAESATSPTIRRQLLDIAAQYERLAVSLDGMNQPPA